MPKSKKHPKMPKWIWQLRNNPLNREQKHFLAYIWWCGDRGMRDWDWWLMKRFGKSRRTIQVWVRHLKQLRLVHVQFPGTKHRTIYRLPYYRKDVWLFKSGLISTLHPAQKTAHISNAKHKNIYKTKYSYARDGRRERPTDRPIVSEAEKLGNVLPQGLAPPDTPAVVQSGKPGPDAQTKIREMFEELYTKQFIRQGWPKDRAERIAKQKAKETTAKSG